MRGGVACAIAATLFATACRERDERWEASAVTEAPLVLGDTLAFVQTSASRLVLVDPASGVARTTPLVDDIRAVASTGAEILLIGGGGRTPVLERVDAAGVRQRVSIPGAYDRVVPSPDGRSALLLYDPAVAPAPGAPPARNANELAVVDLVAGTARREVLGTESVAPRDLVFGSGTLVAVLLDSAIALIDLSGSVPPLRVPLELPGGQRLAPVKALFSPDEAFLYVQTAALGDVLALELLREPTALRASINFLPGPTGARLLDIALPADDPALIHAVAAAHCCAPERTLSVLDARGDTSRNHVVETPVPGTSLLSLGDGTLLFHSAAAYGSSGGGAYIAAWDAAGDRLDAVELPGAAVGPLRPTSAGLVFVEHVVPATGEHAVVALTLSRDGGRLRARTSPVVVGGTLTAVTADRTRGEVYLGVTVPREDSGAAPDELDDERFSTPTGVIVVVRGEGLEIVGVPLDATIDQLGLVGSRLFAVHPGATGHLSFLPRDDLRREAVYETEALLLADVLAEVTP